MDLLVISLWEIKGVKMLNKIKSFLNNDIKNEKYALSDDKKFGKVAMQKAPTSWVRSTCGSYRDWETLDRKSTRLNSSHITRSRMPSSA